jgi:4a-hydroxytetrahydrobiopterin dehydratase
MGAERSRRKRSAEETMARTKLGESQIRDRLVALPGWTYEGGKLHREYRFPDFVAAFGFMASAALVAQAMDHHPEWFNVYASVRIDLTTHDAGGVTERDFALAERMEALARPLLRV